MLVVLVGAGRGGAELCSYCSDQQWFRVVLCSTNTGA